MRKTEKILFLLFILTGLLYSLYLDSGEIAEVSTADNEKIKVLRAVDGDTLELANKERVRMLGVNTPEEGEFNAEADFIFTKQLENKIILLERFEKDQYGRTLGYVFYEGVLFNEELLKNGLAHFYSYSEDKYTPQLKKAEDFARENNLGIWEKSPNFGCLVLINLKYTEDGKRCTNRENIILENSCGTLQVYLKDDTSKGSHYNISKGTFSQNYSCKFNDDGDSLFIWDDKGLVLFERYT